MEVIGIVAAEDYKKNSCSNLLIGTKIVFL